MKTEHNGRLTSRDYEREAKSTRSRLARSLDELSDRLTPGQVLDEALTYAKGGGGTFLRTLSNAGRENPVPSLLIGAGCMMFLSEKMGFSQYLTRGAGAAQAAERSGTAAKPRTTAQTIADQTVEDADGMKQQVSEKVSESAKEARKVAGDIGDQVSGAVDQIKVAASSMADTVKGTSSALADQAQASAGEIGRKAVNAARQARQTTASFVDEQPLLCAAVGLAVGAAIAAMIPTTETENTLMGDASDAVKDTLGEAASEQLQTAKTAAMKVAGDTKMAAQRESLNKAHETSAGSASSFG